MPTLQPLLHQESLLSSADASSGAVTELQPQEPTFSTTETPIKVDLAVRNQNLVESLRLLGKVSQRYGFERASDPDNPRLRDSLQRRYGGGLEEAVERARTNRDDTQETGTGVGVMAREHFYTAFGHLALLNGMDRDSVNTVRDADWKEFKKKFLAQPHGRKRRANYMAKLKRAEKPTA